jgi:hypothetical protein
VNVTSRLTLEAVYSTTVIDDLAGLPPVWSLEVRASGEDGGPHEVVAVEVVAMAR